MINMQGIDPSAHCTTNWKLTSFVEEHINASDSIPYICITKSWLKNQITNAQIAIPNYEILRQDRKSRHCGGVLLYIHNSLPVSEVWTYDDDVCEAIVCHIESNNTKVAAVYRPPDTKTKNFEQLLKFLQTYLNPDDHNTFTEVVIMGDFNLPGLKWNENHEGENTKTNRLFLDFLDNNMLSQYVDKPTRKKNILDLFLTNNPNLVLHTTSEETKLSDHNIVKIYTTYSITAPRKSYKPHYEQLSFRDINLHKANFDLINEDLRTIDWEYLKSICPANDYPELFRLIVLQICMEHAPIKSQRNTNINLYVRKRNTLRRRKRKIKPQIQALKQENPKSTKLVKLRAELYDIEHKIIDSITEQQKEREANILTKITENPRYFYSYAKRFAKRKSRIGPLLNNDNTLEDDPKKMADILQNQYTSVFSDPCSKKIKYPNLNINIEQTISNIEITTKKLIKAIDEISIDSSCGQDDIPAIVLKNCKLTLCHPLKLIWEDSMERGYIAKQFKDQIVTPVHKKASKAEAANYRPISLTSHVIKVFERIIRDAIVSHLENQMLLCPNQHGFRPGRSCFTQLVLHIDKIMHNLLNNEETDVIYLDYAKAFDKVDHQILLKKLHAYGIRGKLLTWLHNYLTNRHQTVVIDGQHSYPAKVISGVPQGTVLGPILFIIYLNDLQSCVKHSVISSFADDTRIKKSINRTEDTQLLQSDLDSAITWSEENNMLLHQQKFELIIHTSDPKNPLHELPFQTEYKQYHTADGSLISPQPTVKDLGITISSDLSWSPHIKNIAEDSKKISNWILSVFFDRSANTMLPLYKLLVRTKVEYNCPLWNPSKIEDIKRIESIQRSFTSKISEVNHLAYWDRLKKLKLMSLQRRRERFIILQVFKVYQGLSPNDLGLEFTHSARRGQCCKIPPLSKTSTAKSQSIFDKSFRISSAKLWNRVPKDIRAKPSFNSFKLALTKYLLQLPDCPPVPGISSNNSLLDLSLEQPNADNTINGGQELRSLLTR